MDVDNERTLRHINNRWMLVIRINVVAGVAMPRDWLIAQRLEIPRSNRHVGLVNLILKGLELFRCNRFPLL